MHLNNLPELKAFRRKLRKGMTPAEARLWVMLRGSLVEGRKFRRQHGFSGYILDFYCPSEKLAVELDGDGHFREGQAEYDHERKLFLRYFGVLVLRFENRLVFEEQEYVLDRIKGRFGWNRGMEKEAWIDDLSFSQE